MAPAHLLRVALALPLALAACSDPPLDPAVIQKTGCPAAAAHPTAISLDVDDLIVTADYGGCHPTHLWGCWGGTFAPSDPPQVSVAISYDDAGTCDALQIQTARISLRPMLDEFQAWSTGPLRVVVTPAGGEVLWQPH